MIRSFLFILVLFGFLAAFGQMTSKRHYGIKKSIPASEINNTQYTKKCEFKVNFRLKMDSIWQAPVRGQHTEMYLVLEMTNLGNDPIRFPVMDKFKVSMQYRDENELKMEGGQDVLIPGKPISDPVPPGEKHFITLPVRLGWGADDQLQLSLKDSFGSIWWIGPLKAGSYLLTMHYDSQPEVNKNNPDLWSGHANINPVFIQIIY